MVSRLRQYCHSSDHHTVPIYGSATLGRVSAKVTTTDTNGQLVVARWAEEQIYLPHLDTGNAYDPIWTVDTQSTDEVDDSRAWIHCTSTRIASLVPSKQRWGQSPGQAKQ